MRSLLAAFCAVLGGCGGMSDGGPLPLTFGPGEDSGGAPQGEAGTDTDSATGQGDATMGPPTSGDTPTSGTPSGPATGDVTATSGDADTTAAPGTDGDSSGSAVPTAPSLFQAAFNPTTEAYQFGYMSIEELPIVDAPGDVDWDRWAMLHDGSQYRLYFLPTGSEDSVYQFAYNDDNDAYEYGYMSTPSIPISGAPAGIDSSSFAMLHDGDTYRLYFLAAAAPLRVYQFGYDPAEGEYVYGYNATTQIDITGSPAAVDWAGWAMLFDGDTYRLYAFANPAHDAIAQFAYNPAAGEYQHGYMSFETIDLEDIPAMASTAQFAMLSDDTDYRLYMLGT